MVTSYILDITTIFYYYLETHLSLQTIIPSIMYMQYTVLNIQYCDLISMLNKIVELMTYKCLIELIFNVM